MKSTPPVKICSTADAGTASAAASQEFSCSHGAYKWYYSRYPLDLSIIFCIFAMFSVSAKSLHISALHLHEDGI
jgi:hypothetical protein